jgi:hypothetical protein
MENPMAWSASERWKRTRQRTARKQEPTVKFFADLDLSPESRQTVTTGA